MKCQSLGRRVHHLGFRAQSLGLRWGGRGEPGCGRWRGAQGGRGARVPPPAGASRATAAASPNMAAPDGVPAFGEGSTHSPGEQGTNTGCGGGVELDAGA